MMNNKIDFVLIWVDGNDPEWRKEYLKYASLSNGDKNEIRFRDWDNLRYWFRGVDKFAPWVHKVHLVTCGQKPDWLNLKSEKLNLVKHCDYIPNHFLPTFNANTIELNLHKISGLAEQFVYFNDDTFIIDNIKPEDFFKGGLPCDMAVLNTIDNLLIGNIILNDVLAINRIFNKNDVIKSNLSKWINIKYASYLFRTLLLMPWKSFPGFLNPHLPNAYLKKTFFEVWNAFPDILEKTSASRFREIDNVNQYLFRYWQLCTGQFVPRNVCSSAYSTSIQDDNILNITTKIQNQMYKIICLNDSAKIRNYEKCRDDINEAFKFIFPNKSQFEL